MKFFTSAAELWLDDEGIARLCVLQEAVIELKEAEEIIAAYLKLVKKSNEPKLLLSDARGLKTASHEARNIFSSENAGKYIIANAVIVNSLSTRLIVNFFIKFHRPSFPVKIFNSEAEALRWLKKFHITGTR